jgi:DNA-binding CsgD family transcriptional regulator
MTTIQKRDVAVKPKGRNPHPDFGKHADKLKERRLTNQDKKKPLDLNILRKMAEQQCTVNQIANVLDCHVDTIYHQASDILRIGKDTGRATLIANMWEKANIEKDTKMMIWLSKQYLGMKESWPEQPSQVIYNVNVQL